MYPPRVVMPASSRQADAFTPVIQRSFQALLAIVLTGVVYRYCWIGDS